MKSTKRYTFVAILAFMVSSIETFGQSTDHQTKPPVKVYLLGTFHFRQVDEDYDILGDKHQQSIKELCHIIVQQQPDKIFVERQPEFESKNKINEKYQQYLATKELKYTNEIYQVGFRVAEMMNHSKVYQCDHPGQYGRYYTAAKDYALQNGQKNILEDNAPGVVPREDDLVNEDSLMYAVSLLDYIRWINSDAVMNSSHANYISGFPQIGSIDYYNYDDDDTLIGAELVADWYRRNIMIYTKMINQLSYEEKAIFLLMGGDHIPIIRNLFNGNPNFKVIEPKDWLGSL